MEDKYGNIVGNMEFQRQKIIELVEGVENFAILVSIYSFAMGVLSAKEKEGTD